MNEKIYIIIEETPYSHDIISVWSDEQEAEKSIIRETKRQMWVGGVELEEIDEMSKEDIERESSSFYIVELPLNIDADVAQSGLALDGYPLPEE